jgi:hypothetical protein
MRIRPPISRETIVNVSRAWRAAPILLTLLGVLAAPAEAHHVLWLDFSEFTLAGWPLIDGRAPTTNDKYLMRDRIVTSVMRAYAPFDVYVTEVQPANGVYAHVKFLPGDRGNTLGHTAGAGCEMESYTPGHSYSEVYVGSFAGSATYQGAKATTARIARGIAQTTSHEIGHGLGLGHAFGADDYYDWFRATCHLYSPTNMPNDCRDGFDTFSLSNDPNQKFHVMSTLASSEEKATNTMFFDLHSSRWLLGRRLQLRNHWTTMPEIDDGTTGGVDLVFARGSGVEDLVWWAMPSDEASQTFGPVRTLSVDAGFANGLTLVGDVTGDGKADLLQGSMTASATVSWWVYKGTGTSFVEHCNVAPIYCPAPWTADAGNVGDIFRLADVTGDGKADLIYGRPHSNAQVSWYVRPSTGSGFLSYTTWASDAGNSGDLFLFGDVTNDGRADLVAVRRSNRYAYVYRATGSSFVSEGGSEIPSGVDLVMLGNVDSSSGADLVMGTIESSAVVRWRVASSTRCAGACFAASTSYGSAGDAGDQFRLGDADRDGRAELFYGRGVDLVASPPSSATVKWWGRQPSGGVFTNLKVWANDAGNDGDLFP